MRRNFVIFALGFGFLFHTTLANAAIECVHKHDQKWVLHNSEKNFHYGGNAVYFSESDCLLAKANTNQGFICAPNYQGSAQNFLGSSIYDIATGKIIGSDHFFAHVEACVEAVQYAHDRTVCVPYVPSSKLFDAKNGRFVNNDIYNDVYACSWASFSASSKDNYICGPNDWGTSIFNRLDGTWADKNRIVYYNAADCYRNLDVWRQENESI